MGYTSDFLAKRRKAWLRRITKAQYYTNGAWRDGAITTKEVSGTNMIVRFEAADGGSTAITQLRLIDEDGSVAYTVNVNIQRSNSRRGALLEIVSSLTAT
jgi:hypothetical protein